MASNRAAMTDHELLDAWSNGDNRAAAELFERHFAGVNRFFRNTVPDYDDLVQQTFTACLENRSHLRSGTAFRTYLLRTANKVLQSHFRSCRREAERIEWTEVSACDLAPGPSTMFSEREERKLLLESLRRIPLDYQVMFELYYWEELPGSAIAEIVDLPESTVRSRIRKGKKLLEKQLRKLAKNHDELTRTLGDLESWVTSIRSGSGDMTSTELLSMSWRPGEPLASVAADGRVGYSASAQLPAPNTSPAELPQACVVELTANIAPEHVELVHEFAESLRAAFRASGNGELSLVEAGSK